MGRISLGRETGPIQNVLPVVSNPLGNKYIFLNAVTENFFSTTLQVLNLPRGGGGGGTAGIFAGAFLRRELRVRRVATTWLVAFLIGFLARFLIGFWIEFPALKLEERELDLEELDLELRPFDSEFEPIDPEHDSLDPELELLDPELESLDPELELVSELDLELDLELELVFNLGFFLCRPIVVSEKKYKDKDFAKGIKFKGKWKWRKNLPEIVGFMETSSSDSELDSDLVIFDGIEAACFLIGFWEASNSDSELIVGVISVGSK